MSGQQPTLVTAGAVVWPAVVAFVAGVVAQVALAVHGVAPPLAADHTPALVKVPAQEE